MLVCHQQITQMGLKFNGDGYLNLLFQGFLNLSLKPEKFDIISIRALKYPAVLNKTDMGGKCVTAAG